MNRTTKKMAKSKKQDLSCRKFFPDWSRSMNYSMSQKLSKIFLLILSTTKELLDMMIITWNKRLLLNLCYFNNVLYYQTIKEIFDKFRVMSSSLMLDLINDMRQDGTYKDQEQSFSFLWQCNMLFIWENKITFH